MKKQNTIHSFDQTNFDIEKNKLDINLQVFLELENSFQNITGSKTFLTIEALQKVIIAKSGFPNLEASVKLLDFEKSYNYILKYVDDVVLELIDIDAKTILKQAVNELNERFTYRLNDIGNSDHKIILEIIELYTKLINPYSIRSIETYDNKTYNCNLQSLNNLNTQK
jgi:hypothetical protein